MIPDNKHPSSVPSTLLRTKEPTPLLRMYLSEVNQTRISPKQKTPPLPLNTTIMSFQSLIQQYPFLPDVLSEEILQYVETLTDDTAVDDRSFVYAADVYFTVRHLYNTANDQEHLQSLYLDSKKDGMAGKNRQYVEALRALLERLRENIRHMSQYGQRDHQEESNGSDHDNDDATDVNGKGQIRQSHRLPPRIVRLARKLELSEKEEMAVLFIVVSSAGVLFPAHYTRCNEVRVMGLFCDMDSVELVHFCAEDRLHAKQSLVHVDTEYRNCLSECNTVMPLEVTAALVGHKISSDSFLKIDKTALAEVLMEEPEFKMYGEEAEEGEAEKEKTDNDDDQDANGAAEGVIEDEDFDIHAFIQHDSSRTADLTTVGDSDLDASTDKLKPYTTSLEYCEDRFQLLAITIRIKALEKDILEDSSRRDMSNETKLREHKARERMLRSKCERRLKITLDQSNDFVPRLEKLARSRKLNEFEKWVCLYIIGSVVSHDMIAAMDSRGSCTVGRLLYVLNSTLEERMHHRRFFYKTGALVRDSIIRVSDPFGSDDLMDCDVSIDRRVLDYVLGLDTESDQLVEGTHLYTPSVQLDQVVLPAETKKLIVDTVTNFDKFQSAKKRLGLDDIISYGTNMVLLFYGASGTGKTLMANALASSLGKKILVINFGNIQKSAEVLQLIFLEAKIHGAIVFFDECETFFENRDSGRSDVAALLTEIERHDGLVVMATNRAYDLDEAMQRRIMLAVEFTPPDHRMRQEIWRKHMPKIGVADTVDLERLALNYELSGGTIKNAVVSALSIAVARNADDPIITQEDLEQGCKLQLRHALRATRFDKRIVPVRGMEHLIVQERLFAQLNDIVRFEKSRKILTTQWGFGDTGGLATRGMGQSILMVGESGTGRSLAAEAIAFELGMSIKLVHLSETLFRSLHQTTNSISTVFRDAEQSGAVLVVEALPETLTEEYRQPLSIFLSAMDFFNGMCILIVNGSEGANGLLMDLGAKRRFRHILEFTRPDLDLRRKLWKKLMPSKLPIDESSVDTDALSKQFHDFTGGRIGSAIFRAASKAALSTLQKVTQEMLVKSCEEEQVLSVGSGQSKSSLYS